MANHGDVASESAGSGMMMLTVREVADLLRCSERKVLMLPIRQYKVGERGTLYRLADVYEYLGVDNPNL